MAIGLIAWGRFPDPQHPGQRITVPAPVEGTGKPWLWDFIAAEARELAKRFDAVQFPPCSMAQGGTGAGCDGYGVSARWNLGTESAPTRYGCKDALMAAVAALRKYGVKAYGDLVLHQLLGPENGGPGVNLYPSGKGNTTPGWFRGNTQPILNPDGSFTGKYADPVPPFCLEDDVPSPVDDRPFGREISYQNSKPRDVTLVDALNYISYLKDLGFAGFRIDDVKGIWPPAVHGFVAAADGAPCYGEYFDGDPRNLNAWATGAPMISKCAVEDFTLHFRIQAACNGFDATQFNNGGAGFWEWNPDLSVGFVDNPDTDTSPGQQVVFNKGIAYAYLLTLPLELALVYGKDMYPDSVWPGAYGLQVCISNLCWISRTFAIGAYQVRYVDRDVHVATRDGNGGAYGWSGGLLTAINFNVLTPRTVTVQTMWTEGKRVHDYSGHASDVTVGRNGMLTVTIPSNAYSGGTSYVCYAPFVK